MAYLLGRLLFLPVWVVAVAMVLLFFYDIIMVFITPFMTPVRRGGREGGRAGGRAGGRERGWAGGRARACRSNSPHKGLCSSMKSSLHGNTRAKHVDIIPSPDLYCTCAGGRCRRGVGGGCQCCTGFYTEGGPWDIPGISGGSYQEGPP